MPDIVIKAENLGKSYIIGHQAEISGGYLALRDVLVQNLNNFWHKTKDLVQGKPIIQGTTQEEFWALKDVSFEIQRGDAVGIIGRNGAGKSTLLKILSRITEPSTGRVTIKGRVSSLLEVGTGFHPELSGRENIYLNGAILGMTRAEVKMKFDEIVDFSGVEQFLDTPVKRFSSGMYVRLAFAVAAHLEPEILIVDEVLAVGDAEFQKKCLGKMGDVANEGRTVLFVSHNMGAIERLCSSGIILDKGKPIFISRSISNVVNEYLNHQSNKLSIVWENLDGLFHSDHFFLKKIYISDVNDKLLPSVVDNSKDIYVNLEFIVNIRDIALEIACHVFDNANRLIFISHQTDTSQEEWPYINKGFNKLRLKIPKRFLNEGQYYIKPGASLYKTKSIMDPAHHAIGVSLKIVGGLSESPYWYSKRAGILAPILEWENIK